MPEPAASNHGTTSTLPPPSANGFARPPPALSSPRVSYDPALTRHGAVDGGWWPHSRNALTELPGLIATLDSRPGIRVQRLSVHRDEWDEIPPRLTAGGHAVRVDWFTTIPRHTVSVTATGKDPIALLVVPPATAEGTAQTAMNTAAASRGAGQAADILTASEPGAACQPDPGPVTA
jgi:hypothetical protein